MSGIGVFASVEIVTSDGTVIPMWGPKRSFITGVTVQQSYGAINQISIELDAPLKEGIALLESGIFSIKNILKVRLGYSKAGFATPWFTGIISQPGITLSAEGLTGTIEATGPGGESMVNQSGKSWTGSPWQVIQAMAKKYGWSVDIGEGESEAKAKSADADWKMVQAGQSDWSFLRQVSEAHGLYVWIGNNTKGRSTLFVRVRSAELNNQPKRTFMLYGGYDESKNQYPAISLSVETSADTIFSSPGTRGIRFLELMEDGEVFEKIVSPKDVLETALAQTSVGGTEATATDAETGTRSDTAPNDGDIEGAGVIMANPDSSGSSSFIEEVCGEQMMGFPGNAISVTTVGLPSMQVMEMVQIKGASRLFDGPYLVTELTHTVGSSGFDTTWKGLRNALNLGEKDNVSVNTKVASESPDTVDIRPVSIGIKTLDPLY